MPLSVGSVRVFWTDRSAEDLSVDSEDVEDRRQAVVAADWNWLRQVHGSEVVEALGPGSVRGIPADALISKNPDSVLSVTTADCAPIALIGEAGWFGVVHAGWSGLYTGIIEKTVSAMRERGAGEITAIVGPCIHPECYSFSDNDLQRLVDHFGDSVRAQDAHGAPAFDLPEAVQITLRRADVDLHHLENVCTACSPNHFSHRARGEKERQAMLVLGPNVGE